MLRVAVEVGDPLGVLVRRPILVEVLVVFGFVRMTSVGIEAEVGEIRPGVALTGSSVGTGTISDSSIKGVVMAGSVPK